MADKRFAKNVSIFLGIGVVLMLFGFVLVAHHRDIPERIRQDRNALLGAGSNVAERTKAVGRINVASAETQRQPVQVAATAPAEVNGQQVYQSACVACHGAGIAGAPKLGDIGPWAKRIAKGLDTLYASAINGVQGSAGVMPAKGGNPALSDAKVKAAVDYIVAQSK
jgi:cytochrome c5